MAEDETALAQLGDMSDFDQLKELIETTGSLARTALENAYMQMKLGEDAEANLVLADKQITTLKNLAVQSIPMIVALTEGLRATAEQRDEAIEQLKNIQESLDQIPGLFDLASLPNSGIPVQEALDEYMYEHIDESEIVAEEEQAFQDEIDWLIGVLRRDGNMIEADRLEEQRLAAGQATEALIDLTDTLRRAVSLRSSDITARVIGYDGDGDDEEGMAFLDEIDNDVEIEEV
jgi:hypothetical protein